MSPLRWWSFLNSNLTERRLQEGPKLPLLALPSVCECVIVSVSDEQVGTLYRCPLPLVFECVCKWVHVDMPSKVL